MKLPGEEKQEFIIREYCIQNFHLGEVYRKIYDRSCKTYFRNVHEYISSITAPVGEFSDM